MTEYYEFDVFVSYSSLNKDFVNTNILKPLKDAGLKVWIYEKNIKYSGDVLIKQLTEGINSSRKTMVVITKEYLESGWCNFENVFSSTISITEQRERLIVIKVGDVTIPAELKTMPYVENIDTGIIKVIQELKNIPRPAFCFNSGGCVLAIGAHWDDILLGCLGTLLKLKKIFQYKVEVLVLCTSYHPFYYGKPQNNVLDTANEIYDKLCQACGFTNLIPKISEWLDHASIEDQAFETKIDRIKLVFKHIIEKGNQNRNHYNLILCPPLNDKNRDHAVTGENVFSKFRHANHMLLEYSIKHYTDPEFLPNIIIGLDEDYESDVSIAQKKIELLSKELNILETFANSERLFGPYALGARMYMDAIDNIKNQNIQHAEIFRGRFEL